MFEGLRKPEELILTVVILLSYGCPPQAIVHAYGLDERTVARWQKRAGTHCHRVHEALIMQKELDLVHVQAGRVPGEGMPKDPVDGHGGNGQNSFVVGWGSELDS